MFKFIIAAIFFAFIAPANAGDYYNPNDPIRNCETVARTYANVVMLKDMKLSTDDAMAMLMARTQDISPSEKKNIINLVYFDKSFAGVHFEKIKTELFFLDMCIRTIKP